MKIPALGMVSWHYQSAQLLSQLICLPSQAVLPPAKSWEAADTKLTAFPLCSPRIYTPAALQEKQGTHLSRTKIRKYICLQASGWFWLCWLLYYPWWILVCLQPCREQGKHFKINSHTAHMSIKYPSGVKHMWSFISELTSTCSCSGIRKSTLCMTQGHLFPICRGNSQHFKGVRVLPMGKWNSESGSQKWSSLPHFYSDFSDRALMKSFDNIQHCYVLAQLYGCIASPLLTRE